MYVSKLNHKNPKYVLPPLPRRKPKTSRKGIRYLRTVSDCQDFPEVYSMKDFRSIPHSSSAAITKRSSHPSYAGPSRKRSRSPTTPVPIPSPILGALRLSLRDDVVVRGSDEPHLEHDIDSEIQAEIDECIAYADALKASGIDPRVAVEAVDQEDIKTCTRGPVEVRVERVTHPTVPDDNLTAQEEGAVKAPYETLGKPGTKAFQDLDSEIQVHETMPNTQYGATKTHETVNELIDRRVAEALEAHDAARNLEPLVESRGEQGDKNGDDNEGGNGGVNGNRGNGNGGGNGNGNDNGNGYNFGGLMPVARECLYQGFLKCQPLDFNGTEGVVGLTRWVKKMETVFHISNCPQKYQVKYATCTLLNRDLTWWNSHKRAIGFEAAYAMKWTELMKLMTEVYCLRNEIQKMETELWNLIVVDPKP
ncbi:hypothetical protein Tco_0643694 [Tanacetum coccineum]